DANLGASSGGLTLNGGTLDVQGSFTSARPLTISAASTLFIDAGVTMELSGLITGNGNLTASLGGNLILSGSGSNGTGATTISSNSILSLRGSVALGSGNLAINNGGVLELGNGNLTRALGTAAGQINLSGGGGAGFAAWGADRIVNLGGTG